LLSRWFASGRLSELEIVTFGAANAPRLAGREEEANGKNMSSVNSIVVAVYDTHEQAEQTVKALRIRTRRNVVGFYDTATA
jgi:hypothetical protein